MIRVYTLEVMLFFVITALIIGFVLGIYATLTFIVKQAEKDNKSHRRDEMHGGE